MTTVEAERIATVLRPSELALVKRLRELAVPFGSLKVRLTVEYQDGVPVLFRLGRLVAMQEERLK